MNTRARAVTVSIYTSVALVVSRILLNNFTDNFTGNLLLLNLLIALGIGVILSLGTVWMLFYKVDRKHFFTIGIYPFMVILPWWGVMETLISSLRNVFTINFAYLLSGLIIGAFVYLLLLTVNLLNGARLRDVPLGQAAKAVHFIFVMISAYLFFTFLYGSSLGILIDLPLVGGYIGYLVFSSASNLTLITKQQLQLTGLISFVTILAYCVLAIWPLSPIYSTVVMTIVLYILLNLALEMREKMTGYVWTEYLLLGALVIVLMFSNAQWGVNGTIF